MSPPMSERQLVLIMDVLVRYPADRDDLRTALIQGNLSPYQRGELCHLISLEFARSGLDADREPNSRGLELEALLDVINRPRLESSTPSKRE